MVFPVPAMSNYDVYNCRHETFGTCVLYNLCKCNRQQNVRRYWMADMQLSNVYIKYAQTVAHQPP